MEARSGEDDRGADDQVDQVDGLRSDRLLGGRYRLLSRIASGGMASVYVAEHTLIGRQVAIKILHQQYADDVECVRRFLDEGRTVGTLGHPHIVESTDMGRAEDGAPFLVLELLEGRTLELEVRRKGRLPIQRSLRIAQQIASALTAAHAKGIIHRDLKSGNVFLVNRTDGDHVKVLDFGISKFMEGRGHTQKGRLLGTPWFMSPEQINDPASVDARCDVYSLGVIIYEMLAGQVPFADAPFPLVFTKILHQEPPPIRPLCPEISPELEALLGSSLAKSAAQRPQSMEAFSAALAGIVGPYWLEMRARARSQSDFEVANTMRAAGTPAPDFFGRGAGSGAGELMQGPGAGAPMVGLRPPMIRPSPVRTTPPPFGPTTPVTGTAASVDSDRGFHSRVIAPDQVVPRPRSRAPRIFAITLVATACAAAAIYVIAGLLSAGDRERDMSALLPPAPAVDPAQPDPETTVTPPAAETVTPPGPPTAEAAPESAPQPAAEMVHLTIKSSARGAVAKLRGETHRLPLRHEVARGDEAERIEVSAPGHASKTVSLTLDRDRRLVVDLESTGRDSGARARQSETPEEPAAPPPFVGPARGDETAPAGESVPIVPEPIQKPAPAPAPPRAAPARPAVKAPAPGTMNVKAVRETVARKRYGAQVRTCYERGTMDNTQLAGRVVVRIHVDGSGKVTRANIEQSSLGNRSVEACIEGSVETWTLPAPAGGVATSFNYVFNLK